MTALTDTWGREITVTTKGGQDTYSCEGMTISFPEGTDQEAAVAPFNRMAPAGAITLPPPEAPTTITNFQARAALMQMPGLQGPTLFDDVDAMLHKMGGVALQAWEYANDVERAGPLVQQLAAQLGWTPDQLADFFVGASQISA